MVLGGDLRIDGAPRGYQPRVTYPITVTISQPGQSRWGFELTARFADSGEQAGTWAAMDDSTQVGTDSEIQHATQIEEGGRQGPADGPVEFHLKWTAPDNPGGLGHFHRNGSRGGRRDGASGEFVYTAGNFSRPGVAARRNRARGSRRRDPAKAPVRLQETSRVVDLPSPVDLTTGSMEIMIQHRFLQSVSRRRPRAGVRDRLRGEHEHRAELRAHRSHQRRVWRARVSTRSSSLSGTYEIRTANESKWKLALHGGVEGKQNFHRDYSPFLQLVGSLDYRRVRLNVVPTATFNSRSEALLEFNRARAIHPDSNSTFALGLGADIALNRRLSLQAEYVPRLAGYGGLDERRDQVGVAFVVRTWGHVFTILVASSRDFTPSKYGVNAEDRSLSLGFNLYRRIR